MKISYVFLFSILLSFSLNAQDGKLLVQKTKYYSLDTDGYYIEVDSTEEYTFYEVFFHQENDEWSKEGQFSSYFKSGELKEEGQYAQGKKTGKWVSWYANGNLQSETSHTGNKHITSIITHKKTYTNERLELYLNKSGDTLVKQGNGFLQKEDESGVIRISGKYVRYLQDSIWLTRRADGKLRFSRLWDNGKFVHGVTYLTQEEKADYGVDSLYYTTIEQVARPKGGTPAFYKYIRDNLTYPKEAKKEQIEGSVILIFVVQKDGSISDVEVARSVHQELDAEAVRIIKSSPKWEPAMQRGIRVKQKISIPITFKL